MINPDEISEEGAANLCAAVVRKAILDYKMICDMEDEFGHLSERDEYEKLKLENFFRSGRYRVFTGGVTLDLLAEKVPELRRIEREK